MVQLYKDSHNPSAFCSDMVTSGAGDFFDQPMLAQFLQSAAGSGTTFFRILHVREDSLPNILVPKTVDQVPAIANNLHDTQDIGSPYVKARNAFSFDRFPGADSPDFLLDRLDRHDIYHGIHKPLVAGF